MAFSDRIKTDSNGRKYVKVVKGDTLWGIAEGYYGSGNGSKYTTLAAINNLKNADIICVNQIIYLTTSSGSGSNKNKSANKVAVTQFGYQADVDNKLFIAWDWDRGATENYQVQWSYYTANKRWFDEDITTTTHKYSLYSIPSNAKKVRVRVRPYKKKTSGDKEAYWPDDGVYWTSFDDNKTAIDYVPATPTNLSVTQDGYKLTASVSNLTDDPDSVRFKLVKNHSETVSTKLVSVKMAYAAYTFTISPGGTYNVQCQSVKDSVESEWSNFSSDVKTPPEAPSKFTKCEPSNATGEPSIYLEWSKVNNAETYTIQYAQKESHFDTSDQVTEVSGIETNAREISNGIENGKKYYFRVKAVNQQGSSDWSEISSTIFGTGPAAPTTWSSTTTVVSGEPLTLYWVHNSQDGSAQTWAHIEIYVDSVLKISEHIKNDSDEDDINKTSKYEVKMNYSSGDAFPEGTPIYPEGAKIEWRVRTAGIYGTSDKNSEQKVYGEWSILRSVDVYAQPTLTLSIVDTDNNPIDILKTLPFRVKALASPNTQTPVGYYLTIASNDNYESVDNLGRAITIKPGDLVYAEHFDENMPLDKEISANHITLENGMSYTIKCTVSMNSGLTAEATIDDFRVSWVEEEYVPCAEVTIDKDTYSATIIPQCSRYFTRNYRVNRVGSVYLKTTDVVGDVYGKEISGVTTSSGEQVCYGVSSEGTSVYYCSVYESEVVTDVLLSVYRREFDGRFTELIVDLDASLQSAISDPHPALDYARYRILVKSKTTGAISYADLGGVPVGGKSIVIQWDEQWATFDTHGSDEEPTQPLWSGSLLKLPYNIDISNKHKSDVSFVEYIGREHPVSYYGTQLGETSTWNVLIEKDDLETLHALKKLAIWQGDVYVREPSGSGYWANVSISFSQKHLEVTTPVTIEVTRVEGGM